MSDPIFLIVFAIVFFPLFLINFDRIYKTQKEIVELLRDIDRKLAGKSDKDR